MTRLDWDIDSVRCKSWIKCKKCLKGLINIKSKFKYLKKIYKMKLNGTKLKNEIK